jgi:hypothetical protein
MSVIAPCLPGLPEQQRVALGEFLVDPARGRQALVLNGLGDIITRTSLATSAWADSAGLRDEWEDLHLPSVVACALLYAGRAFYPYEDRLWFTWVAGRAAADFLDAKGLSGRLPSAAASALSAPTVQAADAAARSLPSPDSAVPARAGTWPDPRMPASNVPERVPYFTGREEALAGLRRLMRAGRTSVVAVHGMPGMGKTQLALEYAHRFAAEYPNMWWVSSGRPELLGEQFGGLARALGLEISGDVRSVRGVLFDELRRRGRWLLIFDDAPDAAAIQAPAPPITRRYSRSRSIADSMLNRGSGTARTPRVVTMSASHRHVLTFTMTTGPSAAAPPASVGDLVQSPSAA